MEGSRNADVEGFPGQFARTRRFSSGVPQGFVVSADGERVLFLRSVSGTDARGVLWLYQGGRERALAKPAGGAGVEAYAADREAVVVAYTVGGELWTVRTDGGAARRLPTPGPAADPRPSPDGTLIAYAAGGALRVVRADGTQDRALTGPDAEADAPGAKGPGSEGTGAKGPGSERIGSEGEVTYGLPDYTARASIGRSRGYWWSPGSDALLVTRVDTAGVQRRYIADPVHPDRPPRSVPYPAAGTPNARTSLLLVDVDGRCVPVRLPQSADAEPGAGEGPGTGAERGVGAEQSAGAGRGADAGQGAGAEQGEGAEPNPGAELGGGAGQSAGAEHAEVAEQPGAGAGLGGDAGQSAGDGWRWGQGVEYLVAAEWGGAGPVVAVQSRDQRTVLVLRADPATGEVAAVARLSDDAWVDVTPGTPLHTASGVPVLPCVRGDDRGIRVGDRPTPAGLQVRAVLGAVGERVMFTASADPLQTHVWAYSPEGGFEQLSAAAGVHTAAAGGDTVVLDSRTPDGHTVTVLRAGRPAGSIAVLAERPSVVPRPVHLTLGRRELRSRLHLPSWHRPGSGPLPVLLSPYAGPAMQLVTLAQGWQPAVCQWFAEQGFAVLVADGRGTPGRGVAWQRAILGDRLRPVLDDQVDALHAAAERHPDLDLGRVAIRGWSFSGYLAAGAVLLRPDVFHAAVAGAAPAERRLYDSYWEERFLGHPDVQPDAYERCSLLPLAHRLARPLMLVHGLADDNVYPAHTLRLSAALLAAGRPHTVLPLPGTGHLVAREGVADNLLRLERDFLVQALGVELPSA
ncbi:prolyl oligopeptidase family serine peptidase [Streptacidiphilus sp. PB12-B1b]|uniref:prolyl oligopeptidase family serine peptidase n=1 Tax=Streptacidiphilus sp. PB12-B1b TaxID=2705012 RepID=UPI0015FD67A3|nr:prolyl oligopeptidase family serine peptidase [Streptacidiphilus sp. PB12-B1b]QMU79712.1 prolyl oligopeptidase family serine peptidase [Streptacidiphilus sp. PB12-B1b]